VVCAVQAEGQRQCPHLATLAAGVPVVDAVGAAVVYVAARADTFSVLPTADVSAGHGVPTARLHVHRGRRDAVASSPGAVERPA
jgi:hypothetical protein